MTNRASIVRALSCLGILAIVATPVRAATKLYSFSTFAGASLRGSTDGTGSAARFNNPNGIAVDTSGNVYVVDTGNFTIRKITPAGVVTTFAGFPLASGSSDGTGSAARFTSPAGVAVDTAGNLYVTDSNSVRKITPAGVVTTLAGTIGATGSTDATGSAARFNGAAGIAVDPSTGNIYVADQSNFKVRRVSPAGVVTTLAGTGTRGTLVSCP